MSSDTPLEDPAPSRRSQLLAAGVARAATLSLRLLLITGAVVVLTLVLGTLWVVVLPVLLGLLLATVLWPPTRLLRRVVPPALAASLVIVSAVVLLGGLGTLLAPQVAGQSGELVDAAVAGLEDLEQRLSGPPFHVDDDQISNAVDQLIGQIQSNAQSLVGGVLTGVSTAGSLVLSAVLAVVLCFFYLKDGPRFLPWLSGWVGSTAAPHACEVASRSWITLSGFIRAQAGVGLVDAVAIGVGLAIIGVPLALPLAVFIFFGAFIPIVGAVVTGALAALVALVANGLTSALIVVALVLVVQQLEGNLLQPMLVGRTLDLHPALVILVVTAGGSLAGIAGAFLAVPMLAVTTTVVRYSREQLDAAA